MIGSVVGNYRIVDRLGDGGMGTVYRAVDQMLDRDVAIKVLRPELARNAALIERFRQEAIALARLNHPRIATLHGLEQHGDSLLMIMEYVRGETLEAIVQRSGQLAWARAAELCAATLDALDHAHDKGVVHRDIKPANIMLSANGAVKVMDFGIARLIGKNRQTQVGHAVGTPTYMAPEQLRGEEVDGRTDLYATGAVLFELVTGRMVFEADSDYGLMMKQLNEPPLAVSALVAGVPSALDDIIARAMAKAREDRFPTANGFREALEQLVASVAKPAPRTPLLADTRLAAPADTRLAAAAGSPPTRLATPPLYGAMPPTHADTLDSARAPDAKPASGSEHSTAPETASVPTVAPTARAPTGVWREWRIFAIAAGLLVAGGVAARSFRSMPAAGANDSVVAQETGGATSVDSVNADYVASPPTPTRRTEDASSLIFNPPTRDGGRTPLLPPIATPPARRTASPPAPRQVELSSATVTVDAIDAPSAPEPEVLENDTEALTGIRQALRAAAEVLGGRDTNAAASLLSGDVASEWIALMEEGRISMAISGALDMERRGSRASVEFGANVDVRSPFGANRRRATRFQAQLQRSGSGWRVENLRPVGKLELR